MFNRLIIFIFLLSLSITSAMASLSSAQKTWETTSGASSWRKIVIQLVDAGYPYSAVPFMKEYLVQNRASLDEDLDEAFDKLIAYTGVRPFETLPDNILGQSRSSVVRYILAKKHFRKGRWSESLTELQRVNANHPVYPFAVHLKAAIHSIQGKIAESESDYKDCVSFSRSRYNDESNPVKLRQLLINRDSCIAGIARAAFTRGDYKKADFLYLDIEKSSYIWPEILFEEAWSSYYLQNFNRTLGKLVSYKAPVFDFIFNPEIDVLKALAYMRLCLYEDVNSIVENFYSQWMEPSKNLRGFIVSHGRDYNYYFRLVTTFEQDKVARDFLMQQMLLNISKDPAWQEMKQAYIDSILEFNKLKSSGNSRFNVELMKNVKEVVGEYQDLMGSYARAQFNEKYNALSKTFQDMSFIKLEVLARKKQSLYQDVGEGKKRGDIKYIDRNDKQYFWDFNGEFWADELGDYVFALGSEC
ncbi:MAG: hypothetical protein K2P81_07525 [Bacteriovoracaceae bacterium]|nr:hypothetical protein [Bacteriovoracaceae bacterium]